jgi:signal transduction histidine kinase
VGTGFGVDRLDPATRGIVHYTKADGLAPGEVQDAVRNSAGDLWFGTYKSISRLHPQPDPPPVSLPVKISSVRINGQLEPTSFTASQIVTRDVPPGSNNIQIDYFALGISGTENVRYQYRLEGVDKSWSEAGASRSTLYSNLGPGSYAFQVRCLNPISGEPATVRFTVLPHFWEHWWFILAACLAMLSAFYSAYRYRLDNILKIQSMRTRLARDLHDDIGSGLSKIVILSEVGQRGIKGGPTAVETLDRIAETSREVLDAVGDLVWATNATTERIEDLVRRMRSFATQLFEAQGVAFELHTIDVPVHKTLGPEALRQLYLIFKEAVNNAAKHSGCTHAEAELRFSRGILTLRVSDNGAGFPLQVKPGHHGLESMEARAKSLRGTIVWRNEAGTTVELSMPYLNASSAESVG